MARKSPEEHAIIAVEKQIAAIDRRIAQLTAQRTAAQLTLEKLEGSKK